MSSDADPFEAIRTHRDQVEQIADTETRLGAAARYLLDAACDEKPAPEVSDLAGLPDLQEDDS